MLRISKNIKKVALSLLVVGLAIGTQSMKAEEKVENGLAPFYYGWNGTVYQLIGETYDAGNCDVGTERCVVISPDDTNPTLTSGQASSLPSPGDASDEGQYF